MAAVGQKTKLTRERFHQLVEDIRHGGYVQVAMRRAGIGETTYYRLLDLAAEGREPYGQFWEGIEDANAEVEARLTQLVEAQAPSDWRAAAFILEQRFQDRWKKRE